MSTTYNTLMTIFKNSKKAKSLEKVILSTHADEDLKTVLYNIYGQHLQKIPLSQIEDDIKAGKTNWSSTSWKDHLKAQKELDNFISMPLEVEEGVEKCQKCGSKRTFSKQLQVRSADEGFTTFCRCAQCGANWRIN